MRKRFLNVEPINIGYKRTIKIKYPEKFYQAEQLQNSRLIADFRRVVKEENFSRLDSIDGSIRAENGLIIILLSQSFTKKLQDGFVWFDFARIDESGNIFAVPGRWCWPVTMRITRDVH